MISKFSPELFPKATLITEILGPERASLKHRFGGIHVLHSFPVADFWADSF